jgi:hypothetical protein
MVSHYPDFPVVAFAAFSLFWSVAGLAGYHMYLVALGQTTNEEMKRSYGRASPFSSSWICGNYWRCLCRPLRPSFVLPGVRSGVIDDNFVALDPIVARGGVATASSSSSSSTTSGGSAVIC